MDTVAGQYRSNDLQQVYEDHVVSEDITVVHGAIGGLLSPLLEAHVENKDAKRQDDGDVDDAEDSEADGSRFGVIAPVHLFKHRKGGGEVARHNCWQRKDKFSGETMKISHQRNIPYYCLYFLFIISTLKRLHVKV